MIWGRFGYSDGRFNKPRAIAIDAKDQLYIVDMTARIQVFDTDGNFVRKWQTPASENGRPTGLSIDRQGRIMKRYLGEPDFAALHGTIEKLLAES